MTGPNRFGGSARAAALIHDALGVYRQLGATTVDVSLPHLPLSVPTYYVVAPAECSSNLARFDGVRYGLRDFVAHQIAVALPEPAARAVAAVKAAAVSSSCFFKASSFGEGTPRPPRRAATCLSPLRPPVLSDIYASDIWEVN